MRLELTLLEENINLPASIYLNSLKNRFTDNPGKGLRHPLAMYNISVTKVIASVQKLIDAILESSQAMPDSNNLEVLTLHYLYSMAEHIDACDNIISLIQDSTNNKSSLKHFKENIKQYRNHILTQVNHIKHRQSQVRLITLKDNDRLSHGYFIESATDSEGVGPDPVIHKNKNTAFSYSREMRAATIAIYYISKSLVAALCKLNHPKDSVEENISEKYHELLKNVVSFDAVFFPNEYRNESCEITKIKNKFQISFGKKINEKPPYSKITFQVQTVADGVTRSYGMPYLGG